VLLTVGSAANHTPTITADETSPVSMQSGGHKVITFTAPDEDAANTVAITGAGLPAWAILSSTPGNPGTATLTLDPPAGVTTGSYGMNFDAADNDSSVPLTASLNLQVVVQADPSTTRTGQPAELTTATSAGFTFTSNDPKATFECKLDGGAFDRRARAPRATRRWPTARMTSPCARSTTRAIRIRRRRPIPGWWIPLLRVRRWIILVCRR